MKNHSPHFTLLAALLFISLFFSCTPEIQPPPSPDYSSSAEDTDSSSASETVVSSSSSLLFSSSSGNVLCLFSGICPSIPAGNCNVIGGQIVEVCPVSSSSFALSSSSTIALSSSSSSLVVLSSSSLLSSSSFSNVLCLYSGVCLSITAVECSTVAGQVVQVCPTPSSSSLALSSSSKQSSSSVALPSSSSVALSSSSVIPSSSSIVTITYTLTCGVVPTSGIAGTAITPPTVTCTGSNGTSVAVTSLVWTGAPIWTSPAAGEYKEPVVSVSSGNCSGKSAICSGVLVVAALPSSSSVLPSSSSFVQSVVYQGETYKTVVIGTQTWFQRNLNYAVEGSKCYGDNEANCDKYGRLYDWSTAMSVCPSGWHLPSDAEWTKLTDFVGGSSTAGKKLKAKSGWNSGNGTDEYGFAALPGGGGFFDGGFHGFGYGVGWDGYWWSASEYDSGSAYHRDMNYHNEGVYVDSEFSVKYLLQSVRCLQD